MKHSDIAKVLTVNIIANFDTYLDKDKSTKEQKDIVKNVYNTFKTALKAKSVSYSLIMDVFLFHPDYKGKLDPIKGILFINKLARYVEDSNKYTISYFQSHINYKRNHNTRVDGQSVKITEIFPNAFSKLTKKEWSVVY